MNNANQPWDFGQHMFRHSLHKPFQQRANQPLQISTGSVREERRPHRLISPLRFQCRQSLACVVGELGAVRAGEQTQG